MLVKIVLQITQVLVGTVENLEKVCENLTKKDVLSYLPADLKMNCWFLLFL
jgi:hypothetical protein